MPPKHTGIESFGISEPLTNRIKGILDEYPDGTQIARELLQNSDDARSTVQWYLLDHHDHNKTYRQSSLTTPPFDEKQTTGTDSTGPRLLYSGLQEYMGPALLSGSDSIFEKEDFKSLQSLAASVKRADSTKIGQMGIGFNSIYHLTDCPSFITGDQFVVIEPHELVVEGNAVKCNFVEGNRGLNEFPDQLRMLSALDDIDFSKPYPGTIFRFPLRTKEQAKTSKISNYEYTPAKVREMLVKLTEEAVKALLFLRHVEKIIIYERKEKDNWPTMLFKIEIVNGEEVRAERLKALSNLPSPGESGHQKDVLPPPIKPDESGDQGDVLKYSVRPIFKVTQEDGSVTKEAWHISTLIGNIIKSHKYMQERTDGDLRNHRLIPWVGVAAPTDPQVMIDVSRLFCFLPIGIQLPFPVHINGHFAVKQSRRELWTNQDNDFSSQAAANIKSLWNIHLFEVHIPNAYAMFLEDVGLDHGANYDLWPKPCDMGTGLSAIWQDLSKNVLKAVLSQGRKVFFCGSRTKDNCYLRKYSRLYIAGRDIDRYPLLKESLHSIVSMAEGIPDVILNDIATLITSLGLDQVILTPARVREILFHSQDQWTPTVDSATRIEMLQYCLLDRNVADLEGLPLLPLDGDIWVDFAQDKAQERFFVPRVVFETLSQANAGLVDLNMDNFPFDQIDAANVFWVPMTSSDIARRLRWVYRRACYHDNTAPAGCISQVPDRFPTDEWIMDFWDMAYELTDQMDLLSGLVGFHVFPVGQRQLAPLSLSTECRVIYNGRSAWGDSDITDKVASIIEQNLACSILRPWFRQPNTLLQQYTVEIHHLPGLLDLLHKTTTDQFAGITEVNREHLANFLAKFLLPTTKLTDKQKRTLKRLPVYKRYNRSDLEPLEKITDPSSSTTITTEVQQRLAQGYNSTEHPWIPHSVDLLADGQPLKEHLRVMLEVNVLSESEYWHVLISGLAKRDKSEWDAILTKLAPSYHFHSKDFDFASILRELPFVLVTTKPEAIDSKTSPLKELSSPLQLETPQPSPTPRPRLTPKSVMHLSLAAYFQDNEEVFPVGIYTDVPWFGILSELGMCSMFDSKFVQERFKKLFDAKKLDWEKNRTLVEALYRRLDNECTKEFLTPELRSVLTTVPWVYTGPGPRCGWVTPAECRPQKEHVLVGTTMPCSLGNFTSEALLECVGWNLPAPLSKVLEHLCQIVKRCAAKDPTESKIGSSQDSENDSEQVSEKERKRQAEIITVEVMPIYRYLADKIKDPQSLEEIKSKLRNQAWVLVSGEFFTVDRVARKLQCDLQPHFAQIPACGLDDFFLALGVREHIHQKDMEAILTAVRLKYPEGGPILQEDADLVCRIYTEISSRSDRIWSADLLLLTEDGSLKPATDVVYDDVNVQQSDPAAADFPYAFLHRRISREIANHLHVDMYSARCWDDTKDASFDPFFQQENIVDRITGILNDYDPSSIFNEFLQNAADAGATECHFKLDMKSFNQDRVLSKEMAAWQGPALLIYNNAEFSDEDLRALCKLGVGNKGKDTSKIGRHGLGFNSVYHFTDVPSIVSGPNIGFFDPHMTNLPKSNRSGTPVAMGGHRCDFRKLNVRALADQLEPYKGHFGCDMKSHFKGTLFRLPLRLKGSQALLQSGFSCKGWELKEVQELLQHWIEEAKLGLLFLKEMRSIHVYDGSTPEIVVRKVETCLLEPPKVDGAPTGGVINKGPRPTRRLLNTKITVELSGSQTTSMKVTNWLVYTDCIVSTETMTDMHQLAAKCHWSSHCGVAIPLDNPTHPLKGRLLVHLPTPISTGLPFHIHGGFALTSDRKKLAGGQEKENEKFIWNNFLLERCMPEVALSAFAELVKHMFRDPSLGGPRAQDLDQVITKYFNLWPYKPAQGFEPFLASFVRQSNVKSVFPVRGVSGDHPVVAYTGSMVTMPRCNVIDIPKDLEHRVYRWLRKGSVLVSEVPPKIRQLVRESWTNDMSSKYQEIDGDTIRKRLKEDPDFIPKQLKTPEEKRWMLMVVLDTIRCPEKSVKEKLSELPIIPLRNGEWRPLPISSSRSSESSEVQNISIDTKATPVDKNLPSSSYYLGSPAIYQIIDAKDIFVDENLFNSKELQSILDALVASPNFCILNITWEILACKFYKENSGGVTEDKWTLFWKFMATRPMTSHVEKLSVLKTTYGTMTTIKDVVEDGLQITDIEQGRLAVVSALMGLLQDLGIVVYDAAKHQNHEYFKSMSPYSNLRLISLIAKKWTPSRPLSAKEASHIRDLLYVIPEGITSKLATELGSLPIWRTFGTDGSHLVAAARALYLEGHFTMQSFGTIPNLIKDDNCKHFGKMGATPLTIIEAMMDVAMPKFLNGKLKCEGDVKAEYLELFENLFNASKRPGGASQALMDALLKRRCYLAQDGSFRTCSELIRPYQSLTTTVFEDCPELFPDLSLFRIISGDHLINLRSLESDPQLIVTCAEKVLAETIDSDANPETTQARAKELVKYIYDNPSVGNVDWMDVKWKFVPRETNLGSPYNILAPDLPVYMSFSSLANPLYKNFTWTRLGYFPVDLIPSNSFKGKFPKVCGLGFYNVFMHLNILAKCITPMWKTIEQRQLLKFQLFKVYEFCERAITTDPSLGKDLGKRMSRYMSVPYILNGEDKDPSESSSWAYPHQLMFDIDYDMSSHSVAHKSLHQYRTFLVALGAEEMKHVEGKVEVADERKSGSIEAQMLNCFETQDEKTGFMDLRFEFKDGSSILAHKFILTRASDYYFRRFTQSWADISKRDPEKPGVEVIDMSVYGNAMNSFWGLLYYFYSDKLILTNGPPIFASERGADAGGVDPSIQNEDHGSMEDREAENLPPDVTLSQRVQYLMELQDLANQFDASRLKDLIAQELIIFDRVRHTNVFDVRSHAEVNQAENVRTYCDSYIAQNKSSVTTYINGEIEYRRVELDRLDKEEASIRRESEDKEDLDSKNDDSQSKGEVAISNLESISSERELVGRELCELEKNLIELEALP
ncbi:hypothetical protein EC991_001596 [Linnemannia zychae]|nr:hypothetical protein EC991_001596 [Linnemannia zychae]